MTSTKEGGGAIPGQREQFVHNLGDVTACGILGDWPVIPCGREFRMQGGHMN